MRHDIDDLAHAEIQVGRGGYRPAVDLHDDIAAAEQVGPTIAASVREWYLIISRRKAAHLCETPFVETQMGPA